MTAVVRHRLTALAGVIADLKERVRAAVAGELATAVAAAVHQVVEAVVAGRDDRPTTRRWDEGDDGWDDRDRAWADDPADARDEPAVPPGPAVAAAVAAGVGVARWWLAGRGTRLAAAALGLGVGLLGVVGGPVARAAVAALAAAADLLAAVDAPGPGADPPARS